jgi:flagellar biosynthesis protein FlhF
MKIKKFQAKDFREALALVKREMGNDAVILSSEERKGIMPSVEVTAAVDHDVGTGAGRRTQASGARKALTRTGAHARPSVSVDRADAIAELKREIGSLRETIQDMKKKGYEMNLTEEKTKIYRYLQTRSVRDDLALRLSEEAGDVADLPGMIARDVKTCGIASGRRAVMLVGPTGVGKTTTVAKLASWAMRNRKRPALINLDNYRIGAHEQIRIYSRIMGIPLDIAQDAAALRKSLSKYADRDIIFIDTTGRNPRDEDHINEIRLLHESGFPMETHLLMSASSDDAFMAESHRYYRRLPIDCIAFTKVDEAVRFGPIYNLLSIYQKPVAYMTTGQRVPDDIEFPGSEALVDLILRGGKGKGSREHASCGVAE